MATVLRMPGISADSTEAVLMEWNVTPGGEVSRGDVVASVETEKAVVELEAEDDGVLLKTLAAAGETVSVGGPIAVFVRAGEEAAGEEAILAELGLSGGSGRGPQASGPLEGVDEERSQDMLVPDAQPAMERAADDVVTADQSGTGDRGADVDGAGGDRRGRVFASPLVRRMAGQAGLRLEDIEGSGPRGRIVRRDVERVLSQEVAQPDVVDDQSPTAPAEEPGSAAAAPSPPRAQQQPAGRPAAAGSPATFTDVPHTKFRRAVASALTASKQQVPHFYLRASCRVDDLLELRARVNAESGTKITINDFVVKAASRAMVEVPDMNVVWTPDAVRRFESVDIAVAMASERGLLTPVVRSVQSRALSDLSESIKALGARANAGTLKQQELEGGSMTISNLGMFGVEEFTAIINPPQVAILAVGAATSQPVPRRGRGKVKFGSFVNVVLSVDHRPVDGAMAAQWLQKFKELVESPFRLLV